MTAYVHFGNYTVSAIMFCNDKVYFTEMFVILSGFHYRGGGGGGGSG